MAPARQPLHDLRAEITGRLRARRPEIEEAILLRANAVSSFAATEDLEYLEGLRAAIAAAVEYGLRSVESGEERAGPIPVLILAQARRAASSRVPLEIVLRRYLAGYTALGDFLVQEAGGEDPPVPGPSLHLLQRELAVLLDRLLAAVSVEYREEAEGALRPRPLRLSARVSRLLAGELTDPAEFDYELGAFHLGLIAIGPPADRFLRELAADLDRLLLIVPAAEDAHWAWLGGRRPFDPAELDALVATLPPAELCLAIGEPGHGLRGWRRTHRQAQAALAIALRRPAPLTRYADVALLATVLRDDDLLAHLTDTYLTPLRAGGQVLLTTLRAHFAADRNVSSAAAALGVTRKTVASRLRTVERLLGHSLTERAADLELALGLADLTSATQTLST
jgi:hypothetical protein